MEAGEKKTLYADAMAFFGWPGEKPCIEQATILDLAHVTCAPPIGPAAQSMRETLMAIAKFKHELMQSAEGRVRIVRGGEHLEDVECTKVVLGLQNLPDDVKLGDLDMLYDSGVRVMSLAYSTENRFGSGFLNMDSGLKPEGSTVIRWMEDKGIALDLSHASHRMAREALELIASKNLKVPVMASHGGCYAVYPHARNLPDDVLVGIAQLGGVVGIAQVTFLLHQSDNGFDPVYEHTAHAVKVCGDHAVVVGSDVPYITYTTREEERAVYEKMRVAFDPNGSLASRYPMYAAHNFSFGEQERNMGQKVLGENLINFFRRALAA